jgi:hypothetical protein
LGNELLCPGIFITCKNRQKEKQRNKFISHYL